MFGLIFDVDGVLADTEGPVAEATIAMFEEDYQVRMQPEDFHPFIGTGAVRYVQGPAEKYGLDIDLEKTLAKRQENFTRILSSGRDFAFPGARKLIQAAAEDPQWKLAVATSSPGEKSLVTMDAARIDPKVFDAYIHGDLVTRKKPDPEIYFSAAQGIGISPTRCVVVEDSISGVAAGKAAGMKVIGICNSFPKEALKKADWVIDSLEQVTLNDLEKLLAQ